MKTFWNRPNKPSEDIVLDKSFYYKFWKGFRDYLNLVDSHLSYHEQLYDERENRTYSGFYFGHFTRDFPEVWMAAVTNSKNNSISAQFCFKPGNNNGEAILSELANDKDSIEGYCNTNIDWDMSDKKGKIYRIGITQENVNLKVKTDYESLYEWMHQTLELLERSIMWKLSSYYLSEHNIS